MSELKEDATKLIQEKRLWSQTLLENYLAVALGVRQCSLTTVPGEYPEAMQIAEKIDLAVVGQYREQVGEIDPRRRAKLLLQLKDGIRRAYQVNVRNSVAFKAHLEWTATLGLSQYEMEVRPSLHEVFMFRDKKIQNQLERLSSMRQEYRNELTSSNSKIMRLRTVYPEEFKPEYVRELGILLGYPTCCTDAYISGRAPEGISAEERAADQIRDLRSEGIEPDHFAFMIRDFIPCNPTCRNASEAGKRMQSSFASYDWRLQELLDDCLRKNLELISGYRERIATHEGIMAKKAKELGIALK